MSTLRLSLRFTRSLLIAAAVLCTGRLGYAAVPVVQTTVPSRVPVGSAAFPLTVNGIGFVAGSTVAFNGTTLPTTFLSSTQLQVTVPAALVTLAGTFPVTATNPDPGGGTSAPCPFTVLNPLPRITQIFPTTVTAGTPFTLTVTGSGYAAGATVIINGGGQSRIWVPSSITFNQLIVPGVNLPAVAVYSVGVNNVPPGGGNSGTLPLTAVAPPLTASITVANKMYDATTTATITNCGLAGVSGGDNVTCSGTASFADAKAGNNKTVTGTIVLGGSDAGKYSLASSVATALANIAQRPITVMAAPNAKPYDGNTGAVAIPIITVGALQGNDAGSFTEKYSDKNAGTGKMLTASGFVLDSNSGNNYAVTFVPTTNGAIARRDLTIKAQPNTKTYDRTITAAAIPLVEGLAPGDQMGGLKETYDTAKAETGKLLSVAPGFTVNDGNNGNNYNVFTIGNADGVILKASITLTGPDASIIFGNPLPVLTTLISGPGAEVAAADGITGAPCVLEYPVTFLPVKANADAGTYLVAVSKFDPNVKGENYLTTLVPGTFAILPFPETVTLKLSPVEVVTGASSTFTWVLPVATAGGQVPAKSVTFKICPSSTPVPNASCHDVTPSPTMLQHSGNGLSGVATAAITNPPGVYGVFAVPGDVNSNFSIPTLSANLQVDSGTALPYNLKCDKETLYIPEGGSGTTTCHIIPIASTTSNPTLEISCNEADYGVCLPNPRQVTIGPNEPEANFTLRVLDDGEDAAIHALKACAGSICTAPESISVNREPVRVSGGFLSDGQPIYSVRLNPAGKPSPGVFDTYVLLTNHKSAAIDYDLSFEGKTSECSTGICKAPVDGFYAAGGNPVHVYTGRPGDPGVTEITKSVTLKLLGNAGQELALPLKGGRTLVNRIAVSGSLPAAGQMWLQVNSDPQGAPQSTFHYVSFCAALRIDRLRLSDPLERDLMVANVAPQTLVVPVRINTQMVETTGPWTVSLGGPATMTLLTGNRGEAIPGHGGRDYVPGVLDGTLTANDALVGQIPLKFGPSTFFIEEGANHMPGILDLPPSGTGAGVLVVSAHGTATFPSGATKDFDGSAGADVTGFPPSSDDTLKAPTLWQALRLFPGDSSIHCDAGCGDPDKDPVPTIDRIRCQPTTPCTSCTVPPGSPKGAACSCAMWSRAKPKLPVSDKADPDWVREADQGIWVFPDRDKRVYSCQCGH